MPVAFQELSPSPQIRISRSGQGSSATRTFLIAWADYPQFINEVLGVSSVVAGQQTILYPPSTFPGAPYLVASDVQIEAFPEKPLTSTVTLSTAHNAYEYAKVTVQYEPLPTGNQANNPPDTPEVPDGTFLEVTTDAAGEYVTIPGQRMQWAVMPKSLLPEDVNFGVLLGSESIELNWSRVANPPWSAIQAAKGKINDAAFCGYPAGHVLFLGARRRRTFQVDEVSLWTLGMMFKARSQNWNEVYRSDNEETTAATGWVEVENLDGDPIYESTDFSALFV